MSLPVFVKNKKTGKIYINPAKPFVKPFWLQTDPVKVSVNANSTSDPTPLIVDQTGHMDLAYVVYESTGPFLVNIYDPGRKGNLMNRPIHIDTMAGNAMRPFIFPETYFLNVSGGTRQLTITFTDISGSVNNIKFALHGRRFLHAEAPMDIYKKFQAYFTEKERTNLFFLTTEDAITSLAAGATKRTEFRVPSDSYFEILKLMAVGRRQVTQNATTIAFAQSASQTPATPDTITDSGGGFITAGFKAGMRIKVKSTSGLNDGVYTIAMVVAGTLTLVTSTTATEGIITESAGDAGTVSIVADIEDIDFEVELQEYATGRYLHTRSSVAGITDSIFGRSVFGNGQYPSILFESYLLPRDYRLKVNLKNLHGARTSDFYLTLVGRRLKYVDEGRVR